MGGKERKLPKVGEPAPPFVAHTQKGIIRFPEDFRGKWCVFFCHPANFTSGWQMYSDYLAQKERWLQERDTRLLILSNQTVCGDLWKDIVSRYLSLRFKAPIIEDEDNSIANLYGMSSHQHISPPNHRFLYIIDPEGIIRLIVCRPLPSLQQSLNRIAEELERLQRTSPEDETNQRKITFSLRTDKAEECLDTGMTYQKSRPAHLHVLKPNPN
ncbi:MAG: redoxin domain-containing protein [Saprospiraceae bacterium]|nr:redoxin domain-containing protein [Saprospiraceae bacterium]MDW8482955.1 redoxin domain-containing protein [Saprospiraceae bacterium]